MQGYKVNYLSTDSEGERRMTNGLITMITLMVFILSMTLTVRNAKSYYGITKLENDGIQTKGTIIQRIREPSGRSITYFYIRYEFENKYASQSCTPDIGSRTTPKDKACRITTRNQLITETEYKNLTAPQSVQVLYLPSESKTRSMVTGLSYNKNKLQVNILLSLIALFLSGVFLIKIAFIWIEDTIDRTH